jgi:hypothetical protein
MDGGDAMDGGKAAQTAAQLQWTAAALMIERCHHCLIGKGGGATAAKVMDGSSTQRCNGRRDSSSIVIAMDGGDSDERHWCKGRRDDSGNGSAIAMSGNSFYVQEPPLSFSSIFGVERIFLV